MTEDAPTYVFELEAFSGKPPKPWRAEIWPDRIRATCHEEDKVIEAPVDPKDRRFSMILRWLNRGTQHALLVPGEGKGNTVVLRMAEQQAQQTRALFLTDYQGALKKVLRTPNRAIDLVIGALFLVGGLRDEFTQDIAIGGALIFSFILAWLWPHRLAFAASLVAWLLLSAGLIVTLDFEDHLVRSIFLGLITWITIAQRWGNYRAFERPT